MRKILTSLLILTSWLYAAAGAGRAWEKGALTWAEFTDSPALADSPAYLGTDIVMSARESDSGLFSLKSDAVMYPDKSYAPLSGRTPGALRYFQARFDLAEIMSRRLQQELAAGINGLEADRRLTYYRNLYRTEADRLGTDTRYGNDEKALQTWEYDIRRALEELESPRSVSLAPSPWSYGLSVGIGGVFPTGDIADAFSGACAFNFGIIGGWKRVRLEGSFIYGSPTLRDQTLVESRYEGQGYHANVKNANYMGIGFGAGYAVADTKRFLIEPYIGGQWTSYSWTARPMSTESEGTLVPVGLQQRMQLDDFNLTFGVNFEWHFHSVLTSFPMLSGMREQYVSSLRLTPYATRAVYTDAARRYGGWQIGVTLSYTGVARALGFR